MANSDLVRDFDFPERFEREKHTRIHPNDLKILSLYVLRTMMPPGSKHFAIEALTKVTGVRPFGNDLAVSYICELNRNKGFQHECWLFNTDGFQIIRNADLHIPGLPDEIEMGYFLGSLDPLDVEFSAMAARATLLETQH